MDTISGAGDKLTAFLKRMVDSGSSDLHITAASAPRLRVKGRLDPLDHPPLTADETQDMLCAFLPDAKMERLEKERELRFAFDIEGLARFRGSLFYQRQTLAGVFRVIPHRLGSFDDLSIPPIIQNMCKSRSGLILVSGGRSSGRSTTLNALAFHRVAEAPPLFQPASGSQNYEKRERWSQCSVAFDQSPRYSSSAFSPIGVGRTIREHLYTINM
jgi:Tfp pilus assembly pilus retraction ATPase PilT